MQYKLPTTTKQVKVLTSLKQLIEFPCNLLIQTKLNQFLILSTWLCIFSLIFLRILRLLLSSTIEFHCAAIPATMS